MIVKFRNKNIIIINKISFNNKSILILTKNK